MTSGEPLGPGLASGGEADGRADLFALGSILFEMITGQRAFACENTVDTLHAILHEPAPDLSREGHGVSDSLRAIVSRLLQKAPSDRFQTAADLVWALEQSADWPANRASRPESRPPEPGLARGRPWWTDRRASRGVGLARWRMVDWAPISRRATPLAGTSGARQPFWSPDGHWIGFFAGGKLRKIAADGGPVAILADAPDAKGGAWSSAGA